VNILLLMLFLKIQYFFIILLISNGVITFRHLHEEKKASSLEPHHYSKSYCVQDLLKSDLKNFDSSPFTNTLVI
jgi:hypothetical protein